MNEIVKTHVNNLKTESLSVSINNLESGVEVTASLSQFEKPLKAHKPEEEKTSEE